MPDATSTDYTPSTLHDRYQIDLGEAERLITSFGSDRQELDRLLAAKRPPQVQREEELAAAA